MSSSKFSRFAIPAIAAFSVAIAAPAAMAQTMAPMAPMAPTTKTVTTKTVAKPNGTVVTKTVTTKDRFNTLAAAQATCPTDTVVWSSFTSTHSFHVSTSKYFGKTKHGAYICEQTALAAGYHQSKT